MTRFLMSLEEAVDLVLYAFENAKPGDLFIKKAPSSTIGDLATAVCQHFGPDTKINYIGIRHGEKMNETLMTAEETVKAEDMGDYYRIPVDARDLNYDKYFETGDMNVNLDKSFTKDRSRYSCRHCV